MTAVFGGLDRLEGLDIRVLGDWDDPSDMVRGILDGFNLPANPRVAISNFTAGETVSFLQPILPDAVWLSATQLLHPMRVLKSEADIELMKQAGRITEAPSPNPHRAAPRHDRARDRGRGQLSTAQARLPGPIVHHIALQLRA